MVENLELREIVIRLALTLLAGGLIGLDRGERGRAAGLRTMMLVCLAASATMIQVNLMFNMAGHPADAWVSMDLMRLPLGVLSGIGFIGGGAILRSNNRVTGVTTAATLWFVTIIGLCLGGGLLGLGMTLLTLGLLILRVVKWFENAIPREHQAVLSLCTDSDALDEDQLRKMLSAEELHIIAISWKRRREAGRDETHYHVRLRQSARRTHKRIPDIVHQLSGQQGIHRLAWKPVAG